MTIGDFKAFGLMGILVLESIVVAN